jgi:hypothetical protein
MFCITSAFLVGASIFTAPWEGLGAFLFLASSIPVWYFMLHRKGSVEGWRDWIVERVPWLGRFSGRKVNVPDRMLFQALDNEEEGEGGDGGETAFPDDDNW